MIYICRCGEKTSRCVQCLDQTCNELRSKLKQKEAECERLQNQIESDAVYSSMQKDLIEELQNKLKSEAESE